MLTVNYKNTIFYILLCLLFIGCVPLKQYEKIKNDNMTFSKEREELISEKLTVENTELKAKLESIEDDKIKLAEEERSAITELKKLQEENKGLQIRYDDLYKTHQSLLNGSDSETRQLIQKLEGSQN